jgi:putative intracellular protease/amidase
MKYYKSVLPLILLCCSMIACAQDQPRLKVAIFVHEGVQLLDFSGPGEVFKDAGFEVFAVAPDTTEITSQGFLKIRPNYSIANCPQPDIMVFPGGATGNAMSDDRVIEWIRNTAPGSQFVLSVCTGSLLIAKAGLLDGMTATTHYCLLPGEPR